MRVGLQQAQRTRERVREHQLTRQVHRAVERRRLRARGFGERCVAVGIDRVGADVDHVCGRRRGDRIADRRHHPDVLDQHRGVLDRRARRHHDDGVVGPQPRGQRLRRAGIEQIEVAAAEAEQRHARRVQLPDGGLADESVRAEHDRAGGPVPSARHEMVQHAAACGMSPTPSVRQSNPAARAAARSKTANGSIRTRPRMRRASSASESCANSRQGVMTHSTSASSAASSALPAANTDGPAAVPGTTGSNTRTR